MTGQEKWEELRRRFDSGKRFELVFRKKDDTIRTMICTRDVGIIPITKLPKGTGSPNYKSLPVFDLEKQDWRSFSIDSLISLKEID